jgi:cytochrome c
MAMSQAHEDVAAGGRMRAGRRAAGVLVTLLVVLVLAAIGFIIYEQVHVSTKQERAAVAVTGGNPNKAEAALRRYGCVGCHIVPGIAGASGEVGPNLAGIAQRVYVAGVISNTPEHLISFIVDPQSIDPKSAMPKTGISEEEARDVAAYLYSLGG